MKAALYLRVSTEEQTVENQRAPLEQLAASRGWEPVWYEETGSAAKRRPVFERMMADVRARRVRAVAVVALDRLGRSMVGLVTTLQELDRLRCPLVSVREPWLDMEGPTRELLLAIFAWVAQQERTVLIERTQEGLRRARERGTKSGKPIGRPKVSSILAGAAARHRQEGLSIREAAKKAGISASTLRRRLRALEASRNDEGGPDGAEPPSAA